MPQTTKDLQHKLSKQLQAAKEALQPQLSRWTDRELLALTKLANTDQNKRKSRISLGDLSTIILERTGRTVAQLPSGKIRPVSKVDEIYARVLELAIQRYVIPNATDQFPLDLKLFLIDYFSDVYGGLDVLSYWRVDEEYIGPDCCILNPRDVFWQAGKRNKRQAEYVFVSTFVSAKWLEAKKKHDTWKSDAINRVLKQIKDGNGTKPSARDDANRQTANDDAKRTTASWGDTEEIELVTKYPRNGGEWVSFLPDFNNEIVRTVEKSANEFPVISKEPLLPLIDSIVGQGAMERGEPMQKTLDSVTNLTHDGLKYAIYPIQKYVGTNVQRSTLKWQAGAFWNVKSMDDVGVHQIGSTALNTFLPIQQFLSSKMLNQNGTTSTQISESDKIAGYGKTPEAIKAQSARESTMDRVSRQRLESFYGDLINHWIALLTTKQEAPLEFYIYDDEINIIKNAKGVDVVINEGSKTRKFGKEERYVFGSAKVTVPKGKLKGRYKFIVDTSSSMLEDDSQEHERLTEVMTLALQVGVDQINAMLQQEGQGFSFANLFKRWIITGGAKDWDEIITDVPQNVEDPIQQQMAQQQKIQQMMMQSQMPPQQPMQQPQMPQQMPVAQSVPLQDYQPDPFTQDIVNQIAQNNPFGGLRG